jgi:hypothetical protein
MFPKAPSRARSNTGQHNMEERLTCFVSDGLPVCIRRSISKTLPDMIYPCEDFT